MVIFWVLMNVIAIMNPSWTNANLSQNYCLEEWDKSWTPKYFSYNDYLLSGKIWQIWESNSLFWNKELTNLYNIIRERDEILDRDAESIWEIMPKSSKQTNASDNETFSSKTIESIIWNNEDFKVFIEYAKVIHYKEFKKIEKSKLTEGDKKRKIVELFIDDYKIYWKKTIIKKIQELEFNNWISQRISDIFNESGLLIKPEQLAEIYSISETSWWEYLSLYKKARVSKSQKERTNILNKAVDLAIWIDWVCWPFHIKAEWVENETNDWNYSNNTWKLRKDVYRLFNEWIEKWYTQETINKELAKLDIRFDIEKMSRLILISFTRIYDNLSILWLNEIDKIKLCFIAYNRWENYAMSKAKKIIKKWKKPNELDNLDTKKRMWLLQIASIQNKIEWNDFIVE
jgi:hypothetical protein